MRPLSSLLPLGTPISRLAFYCLLFTVHCSLLSSASQPPFRGQYEISGIDGNTNTGWRLTGVFDDSSLLGYGAVDATNGDLLFHKSSFGDLDIYRVTNIVSVTGINLTIDVAYNEPGTPRSGGPEAGYAILARPITNGVVPRLSGASYQNYSTDLMNDAININLYYAYISAWTNGSGPVDLSAWSSNNALQEITWLEYILIPDTNTLIATGTNLPYDATGSYIADGNRYTRDENVNIQWAMIADVWRWVLVTPYYIWSGSTNALEPHGTYSPYFDTTGTVEVTWGTIESTNTIDWRAGYSRTGRYWHISRDGVIQQQWSPGTNYLPGAVVIGGQPRTNWPDETALAYEIGAGATNLAIAIGAGGSNYADTVGNAVGAGVTNLALEIGAGATNLALAIGAGGSNAVGIMITNYFPLPSGLALSNTVATLTNDVAVLQTHTTNTANPHAVTAAQIGAVPITGETLTGPLTNEYGYYGDGAGLTNLASDPSGWSGYAATQQVVWYEEADSENIDTNVLILSGIVEPDVTGKYVFDSGKGSFYNSSKNVSVSDYRYSWQIWLDYDSCVWQMEDNGFEPIGNYVPTYNATGTVISAYGFLKATNVWRAGYDTNIGAWAVSRNGTNMQAWFPSSNVMTGPVVIGGVARETWPSEYSDAAIYGALNTVSNWTIAGSNLAATVAGNLSVVSNQAAAGSNLAAAVAGNLSVVSNWTVAVSNLSANALPTTGGTMAGPLTNEHGYFGDGAGLTNLPGSTPFDGTELSNSVAGLGILITNAAEQATNYADSVCSAVGLVASNALSMDGGGTVTGDVAVTGGVTAGTLALTNGPVAGSVWVCTNANGSGELRQLAKMRLKPFGSALISDVNATNKWNPTATYSVGGLTGTVEGVKIHRDGAYLVGMNWTANYCTNPAQMGRGLITLNNAVISLMEHNSRIANDAINSTQTLITDASAGDIIGVQYRLVGVSSGQTNLPTHGGQLSVVEMP